MNRCYASLTVSVAFLSLVACRQPAPDSPAVGDEPPSAETAAEEPSAPEETPEERQAALESVFSGDADAMELWNADEIAWMSYESGLEAAASRDVPAIVVVKTGWCSRCRQYANSFSDPNVVTASEEFVMILADQDRVPAVERDLSPDGSYVPRTHFLSPDGVPDASLNSGRTDYRHFVNPSDPSVLLALMERAQDRY